MAIENLQAWSDKQDGLTTAELCFGGAEYEQGSPVVLLTVKTPEDGAVEVQLPPSIARKAAALLIHRADGIELLKAGAK